MLSYLLSLILIPFSSTTPFQPTTMMHTLTHQPSRYSYSSVTSATPSHIELWNCDDIDCNPPYGRLCASCLPKCIEWQEARGYNESEASYRANSPTPARRKKSKDNLFEPDVYLDEIDEEEDEDTKRAVEYLVQELDKIALDDGNKVQKDARDSAGLQGCLERSRNYLKNHRWSMTSFGSKVKEKKASARNSSLQEAQPEVPELMAWPEPQEGETELAEYTRIPETDASEAATQFLYEGQQQSSSIIEGAYSGPFSTLTQEEEDEDETVTERRHRDRLRKWLRGLRDGAFADKESDDDDTSVCSSLYGPLATFDEHAASRPSTAVPRPVRHGVDEYAARRPRTAVPHPVRHDVDETIICRSCGRFFDHWPEPPELHLMKCEFAYAEAARLEASMERQRQRENWLQDRNRSLNKRSSNKKVRSLSRLLPCFS